MDQAYRAAWDAFVAGGEVRPSSGAVADPGMMHLVFLCPIGGLPEVVAHVAPVEQRLAVPYADLVPARLLHVSIQGFEVEQSDWTERRDDLMKAAQVVFARFPAFTLRLGWLNSFPVAAFLRAEDGGMIRRLRAALRETLPRWAGLDRDPMVRDGQDEWLPHLSLAYYNSVHENRAVVEAIAPLREEVIADALVSEIHLISTPSSRTAAERWVWPLHGVFKLAQPDQA